MKKENNNLTYEYTQKSIEDISKLITKHDDHDKHIEQLQNIDKYINAQRKFTKVVLFASILISTALLFVLIKTGVSNDELFNMNKNLIDKQYDSISDVILGVKKDVSKSIKETSKINYRVRQDESIVTYHDLLKENDSLFSKILDDRTKYFSDSLKCLNKDVTIRRLKSDIELITNNYPIKIKKWEDSKSLHTKVVSPRLDSALILYNLMKNRLEYNKKKNEWSVTCK